MRRFAWRGAVNAVPEICSAYSPYGQRCGEFCPTGSAPGSASVANSFAKPDWYSGESGGAPALAASRSRWMVVGIVGS